jgi:hypothetical protein
MTENHHGRKFAEELVSQDNGVSQFDFEEFGMNLDKSLESLERRARSVRRASLIASGLAIATLVLAMLSMATNVRWVVCVLGVCFYLALIVAGVLLTLYWHKYRPAVDRTRSDLQISMISDLQRQIAALSRRLDDRAEK